MKRILAIFYLALLVVMGGATFVEKWHGTDYVSDAIYGSWWFSLLWAIGVAVGMLYFIRQKVKRPSLIALHLAFVLILAGALATHLWGKQGTVYLRKDKTEAQFIDKENRIYEMNFALRLDSFVVEQNPDTHNPSDYISYVTVIKKGGERKAIISMNNIFKEGNIRLYQTSYDDDLQGSRLSMNCDPKGITLTYLGYALLFLSLVWMLCDKRLTYRKKITEMKAMKVNKLALSLPFVLLVVIMAIMGWHFGKKDYDLPVLNTILLPIHVSIIMASYALFAVCTVISIAWLIVKNQDVCTMLTALNKVFLYPAISLLAVGIFVGAIWANISWGNYWSWDSKEVWALITMMIYAIPLHSRSISQMTNDKNFHLFLIFAFLTVLMTYFGVNILLPGMHSYA